MRDPHHQEILDGLAGPLDPQLFEECAVDLLRGIYPGLVPVHGGGDYGMDGAIPDRESEAGPLIVTTAEDVLRNLTHNLETYLASGKSGRQAVVATSRELTPARRRNLERRAREKGFVLLQVHERHDIAGRLYRDSRWTRDLLGITGDPPALSAIPWTRRPLRDDLELIGRDADLEWLRTTEGDRVVVGQPGSGKTYLMLQLVRNDGALFLASDDEGRIAEAVRDMEPTIAIVDDAHVQPERLDRLRHLRKEIGASFDIVATTWPGFEDEVSDALGGISEGQVRHLQGLTRAQIVDVLRGVGVQESDDDLGLRQLVDQASNKPGLAVTLGSLWLRGELRDVLTGKAIRHSLIPSLKRVLKRVLEDDPTQLLACFALGGDHGMTMGVVADFLGVGLGELHRQAVLASQGGVLRVAGEDSLTAEPTLLRYPLLKEVFFPPGSRPRLPYRDLLAGATDSASVTETLVLAALHGVPVPRHELREMVAAFGGPKAWRAFAGLGEEESRWVLDHYSGDCLDVIHPVLQRAPRAGVRKLLQLCEATSTRETTSTQSLEALDDWLRELDESGWRGFLSPLRRREIVIEVVEHVLDRGGRSDAALLAAFMALSPRLESSRETATGDAVVLHQGHLSKQTISRMTELWSRVFARIESWTAELWRRTETVIGEWAAPHLGREVDDEPYRDLARRMVEDLGQRFSDRPGLQQALARWRFLLEMERKSAADEEFQILFPLQEHWTAENWSDERERQDREAADLARAWAKSPAAEVAGRLFRYEEEAEVFLHGNWVMSDSFYGTLAREVDDPQDWFRELTAIGLNPRFAPYLLEAIMEEKQEGWEQLVEASLQNDRFSSFVSLLIIRTQSVSGPLVEQALTSSALEPFQVGGACLRGEVPQETLIRLLRHPRTEISTAAAINEWLADPKGEIRDTLREDWEEAIRRSATLKERPVQSTDFWLAAILGELPDLSFDWMANYLRGLNRSKRWRPEKVLTSAAQAMSIEQRARLLQEVDVGSGYALRWAIKLIVARSVEVFRALLAIEPMRPHHLVPLQGTPPDEAWADLARMALAAGHSPDEIAEQPFFSTGARSGFGESHWNRWRESFSKLARSDEPELRVIAERGLQVAERFLSKSREMRRSFELTGSFG